MEELEVVKYLSLASSDLRRTDLCPELCEKMDRACELILRKLSFAKMVRGRWNKNWCDNNMIGHEYAECSICGCSMLDTNQFWNSKHCPNCGAKMDLTVTDNV